jgi:diguanylate cyclase (GGDEF)-like protein
MSVVIMSVDVMSVVIVAVVIVAVVIVAAAAAAPARRLPRAGTGAGAVPNGFRAPIRRVMPYTPGRVRPAPHRSVVVPAAGALVATAWVLLPARGVLAGLRLGVELAIAMAAAGALFAFRRRSGRSDVRTWLLLAAGQVVHAASATALLSASQMESVTWWTVTRGILTVAHYPLTTAGLLLLLRSRGVGRDRIALLDAGLLLVGVALVSWICLVAPVLRAHGGSGDALVAALCMGAGLGMAAAAMPLLTTGRGRSPAMILFVGGLFCGVLADGAGAYAPFWGSPVAGGLLAGRDLGWSASALLLVAAVRQAAAGGLAAGMPRAGGPPAAPVSGGRGRGSGLILPCAVGLVGPVALGVEVAGGHGPDTLVIAGATTCIVLLIIARMAQSESDQRHLAITDGLTGLRTRRYLEAEMSAATVRARASGVAVGLLLVDVDHFKSINDRFGHPAGDRVLTEVARRLRSVTRPGDIVARYGGEEFALLAMDVQADALADIAERLRLGVAREPVAITALGADRGQDHPDPYPDPDPPPDADRADRDPHLPDTAPATLHVPVTVSVGGAMLPDHAADIAALVAAADRALYAAKEAGRDRIAIGLAIPKPASEPTGAQPSRDLVAPGGWPDGARLAVRVEPVRVARPGGIAMVLPESVAVEAATRAVTAALATALRVVPRHSIGAADSLHQIAEQVDAWHRPRVDGQAVARWLGEVLGVLGFAGLPCHRAQKAARLHNVGKIILSPEALARPGPLGAEEWRLIRLHPLMGARLLARLPDLRVEAEIVAQHREWFAGGGYPAGISGSRIRIEARALAVCTAWAAMCGGRGERAPLSAAAAREQLKAGRATQFDPTVVDVFLRLEAERRVGGPDPNTLGPAPDGLAGPYTACSVARRPRVL